MVGRMVMVIKVEDYVFDLLSLKIVRNLNLEFMSLGKKENLRFSSVLVMNRRYGYVYDW